MLHLRLCLRPLARRPLLLRTLAGDGRSEGSVAQSSGWRYVEPLPPALRQLTPRSKKEKAHEDQYVRQNELEKLRRLRAQIAEAKKELVRRRRTRIRAVVRAYRAQAEVEGDVEKRVDQHGEPEEKK